MPVSAVFENREDGVSIDELIELYHGLTRNQVEAVLDFAARSLERAALSCSVMRILFDQGTPVAIRRFLAGHIIRTARQEGGATLTNGNLLRVVFAA